MNTYQQANTWRMFRIFQPIHGGGNPHDRSHQLPALPGGSLGAIERNLRVWGRTLPGPQVPQVEKALRVATGMGAKPDLARTHCRYGTLMAQKGDRALAKIHLDKARSAFKRLDMTGWLEKIKAQSIT